MSNVTPFVKRMRTVGGTIYVFSSATEDIGLNISERNNVVKMSNYALLNIPDITAPTNPDINKFNVLAIPGAFDSFTTGNTKDGGVLLAESFQNYALNLEANLIAQPTYDPKIPTTVSERVFWKWLKETGAVRWEKSEKPGYWKEELTTPEYSSVVQNIGDITAGSIRYDGYGSYNETYVLVPSSYGKSNIYFKQVEDVNYKHGMAINPNIENILGRQDYTLPHPDALEYRAYYDIMSSVTTLNGHNMTYDGSAGWWTTSEGISPIANSYCTDTNAYISSNVFNNELKYDDGATSVVRFNRSKVDCMSIEYDLRTLYGDASAYTFDDIAMKPLSIGEDYDFNTILIYYSVFASKNSVKPLSTNLLGVLFLDNATGNTSAIKITPAITINRTKKIQGGNSIVGATGFGTSYSFRLNIKTDNMFDDTQSVIYDNSSATTALEETQQLIDALEQSVNILNKHTSTINYISNQYTDIASDQANILNSIVDLQQFNTGVSLGISGLENTIPMFKTATTLTDSSIYIYDNKVGIKTNRPDYDLHVNGNAGVNNLFVSQSIKNSNGDILLGVGSYLNNAPFVREASLDMAYFAWTAGKLVTLGTGGDLTAVNAKLAVHDVSIAWLTNPTNRTSKSYVDGSLGKYFKDTSLGVGFLWNNITNKYDVSVATLNTSSFATITDLSTGLALKANLAGTTIFSGNPQRSTDVSTSDNTNVFATTKFVHSLVDVSLNAKADKIYVDGSLNLKSNLTYVDGSLNLKANITDVSTSLNLKADLTYVDASLNVKTNKNYVDASLSLRDTSISNLSIALTDLSTNYYSPYISTSTAIVPTNSSTYVVVGNIINDRSIIVSYTANRNTSYREGEIRILNTGGALYIKDTYQENTGNPGSNITGITFNAVYIDSSININIVANASDGSSTTVKYAKKMIQA